MGSSLGPAIVQQFETFCRAVLHGSGTTREDGFCRLVTGEPHPLGNFATLSSPVDAELTRRAIEPLRELAMPSAVIFPGEASEELVAVVTESGFALAESMPAMAVDLDALERPGLPAGHELIEVDPARHRDAWNEALSRGYELPSPVAERFGPDRPRANASDCLFRYFAVVADGAMVATSALFLEGGLAGVYCVSTVPEQRGKGLGAHATTEPLHIARDEGYRIGILQSSAMGEPVYKRVGFEQHGVLPLYVRSP
jgi:hypothetical protein